MNKTHLHSVQALGTSAACHAETYPAPVGPSQSDCGGVGLLPPPTARRARDGAMSLTSREPDQSRYSAASV
ncbi:YjbH domain-containing protein, partial [Salmonella enterica subsp. enterica serovar Infantis]